MERCYLCKQIRQTSPDFCQENDLFPGYNKHATFNSPKPSDTYMRQ